MLRPSPQTDREVESVGHPLQRMIYAILLLALFEIGAFPQHGTAPAGYYPLEYHGDIFTGEVTAANDARREITLAYHGRKKDETFVGVLQEHFALKDKNGAVHEIKPSDIPIGARVTVYYFAREQKVDGKKVKSYVVFSITVPAKT